MSVKRHHPFYRVHKCLDFSRKKFGLGKGAKFLHWIFGIVAVLIAAFISFLQFCDPTDSSIPVPIQDSVTWLYDNKFSIALWLMATEAFAGALAWILLSIDEWSIPNSGKLQKVLDGIVDRHFKSRLPEHVYRATLFRANRFWLFGRWLGIAVRSGMTYSRSNTIFSISFDTRSNNTGIAGECWWRANSGQGGQFFTTLPDCRTNNDAGKILDYNTKGCISQLELRQISVRSCFFRAIAIRRRGLVWGVLIIDCTDPSEAPETGNRKDKQHNERLQELLDYSAETISLLIE